MKYLTMIACSLAIFGCGQETKEETKTVDYYVEQTEDRLQKISECKNNPGELMATPNCINAVAAEKKANNPVGSYKEFSPELLDKIREKSS